MAPKTKIFVGHLPDRCTSSELQALFEKYGTVTECDVINKFGFVHMSSAEEAEAAINALNNHEFMGSSLSVEPSKSKLHPEPGAPGRAKGGGGPIRRGPRFMKDDRDRFRNGFRGFGDFPPRGPMYPYRLHPPSYPYDMYESPRYPPPRNMFSRYGESGYPYPYLDYRSRYMLSQPTSQYHRSYYPHRENESGGAYANK